jgi:hypothetical protein
MAHPWPRWLLSSPHAGNPQAVFAHLLKPLLKLYADPTEKVRELSIDLLTK